MIALIALLALAVGGPEGPPLRVLPLRELPQTPAASQPAPPRPLYAGGTVHESLAPGESTVFTIDVPARAAAHVVVRQEGIDLFLKLRRQGSDVPAHGLDFVAGPAGDEELFRPILDTAATWNVVVSASLPKAARGDYTISLELAPADDRARAVAAARQQHYDASETSWIGDGPAHLKASVDYAAAAAAALAAGDTAQAAESSYQCAREHDSIGDPPGAIEWQLKALALFRRVGRRDREARVLNRLGDLSRKVGEVADSERYFEQPLPLARAVNDPTTVADILNNSGLLTICAHTASCTSRRMGRSTPNIPSCRGSCSRSWTRAASRSTASCGCTRSTTSISTPTSSC